MRARSALVLTAPLCLVPLLGRAAPPRASLHLVYERGPGAEQCPDEQTVRTAVLTRLGYDPFHDDAEETLTVRIERAGRALRATLRRGKGGEVTGSKELASSGNDCGELASAVSFAISVAIDPLGALAPPASAPVPEPPASAPPAPAASAPRPAAPRASAEPEPRAPAPIEPPGERIRGRAGVGLGAGGGGTAPRGSLLAGAFVGLRRGAFSINGVGWTGTPSSAAGGVGPAAARTMTYAGALVPCGSISGFALCAELAGALLHSAPGDGSAPGRTGLSGALGPRVEYEGTFGTTRDGAPLFAVRPHLELLVTALPATFSFAAGPWKTTPLAGSGGIDVLAYFP